NIERAKVDDFYAARDGTTPTLPWTSIAPPFTAGFDLRIRAPFVNHLQLP
ncbi:hypothetical protein CLV88_1041, partial [Shimia abyssi]